jgi:tRNA modification GTPase
MIELDVKAAWYSLGEIIGDTNSDTLITELFSRFCLGK